MRNLLLLLFLSANITFAQHSIIPEPVSHKFTSDTFLLNGAFSIPVTYSADPTMGTVSDFVEYAKSIGIESKYGSIEEATIIIDVNLKYDLGKEAYELTVDSKQITIKASANGGLFNAFQTLKQLLPAGKVVEKIIKIPGCVIKDYPRFKWRGLMLDVSRHFFTVNEIKAYLDVMSSYKFNVFHWHLTDDNGWRIEIKSLPKLTEVGAWRVERHGTFGTSITKPVAGEKTPYGGFYTQEQIKDIVRYATARNITIVPEIDIPGHSMAVLSAYPELSTLKEQKMVSPGHKFAFWPGDGTFKMTEENTLDPSNEKVYEFIDKVFGEIASLFPGQYIHMGGDECYKGYWEESSSVQLFMKKNKIKDTHELQSYFVGRVQAIINKYGKKMIGWNEIIEGGLVDGATVMSWQGMKGGVEAAKAGHEVVMSPSTYAYLDYQQGDLSVENSIYSNLSLRKSYEFEPVPDSVDASLILGGQGNVWTEAIPTLQFAYYMTYPRALSVAETVWSPKSKKDWNNFIRKTEDHFDRFETQGVNVCKAVYEPIVSMYKEDGKLMCKLENNVPGTSIFYSVNNTYPVNYATKYVAPFEVPVGKLKLRTQNFRNGEALGRELIISREDLVTRVK
jgi:hexosaminidase